MDFYRYINSPDIAAHCREIKAEFNLLEKATIMHLSDADIIETLTVLRKMLRDEEDMTVLAPNSHNMIPSLKKWLRWSVESMEQGAEFDHTKVDEDWSPDFMGDYYLHIPTPFKKGDIVCERYKPSDEDEEYGYFVDRPKYPKNICVIDKTFDEFAEWAKSLEPFGDEKCEFPYTFSWGDMAAHQAFFVTEDGLIFQDHTDICYTNLAYFAGELKGADRTCKYIGHFLRDEISMIELVGMQNIYLLEHLRNSADYKYIESIIESNIERNMRYMLNSLSEKQQMEDV